MLPCAVPPSSSVNLNALLVHVVLYSYASIDEISVQSYEIAFKMPSSTLGCFVVPLAHQASDASFRVYLVVVAASLP